MFLVEVDAITHLTFGGWGLLVQALAVDLMQGHPNTPMIGVIVGVNQRLQHVHVP